MTQTVFLVDDEPAVRDGLALMLSTYGFKVETFASAAALLESVGDRIGCVVADIRMPGMDGLALQAALARRPVRLPVILITGHGDIPMAVAALKAGALDFIEKPVDDVALVASLRAAFEQASFNADAARLTPREREIVALIVEGRTGAAIADHLGISPRTVEHHRTAAMEKLGAGSLAQLVRQAIRAGIAT
jgi:two-component system, LuxR family, response regulator FixJ